jgi:uncharacterized protein (TIGR02453 family)
VTPPPTPSPITGNRPAETTFRGWPTAAVQFLEGIERDNSKAYWSAHRDIYHTKVRGPMEALLAELAPEFGEGRVFRPYRDVRFSRDQSPYKTNIAARNDAGYFSLSAEVLGVGTGLYMPAPGQLARFRAAVAASRSGSELTGLVDGLRHKRIEVGAHEVLKSAPRGYPPDHPRIELLRYKGLTAWRQWTVGPWLQRASCKVRIVDFLLETGPLRHWLEAHAGSPED